MGDVTQILSQLGSGAPDAADQLMRIVYEDLRRLAAGKVAREASGHTLEPTALVHEAYLRLIGSDPRREWENRKHFFAAAAEAMRRILIENARRKGRLRRGGCHVGVSLREEDVAVEQSSGRCDCPGRGNSPPGSSGCRRGPIGQAPLLHRPNHGECAEVLGVSLRTAERSWTYARTWLHRELSRGDDGRY